MSSTNNSLDYLPIENIKSVFPNDDATPGGVVSNEIREIFTIMNFAVICLIISVFGSITNILNIAVFVKLGFKDPVNITLLSLAISDFGCCASLIWLTICYNPLFQQLDLPFDPVDFHYLTSGCIHSIFTRITSVITAFITFERCLCVAAPLKVKNIITSKRVAIFLTSVVVFVIACFSPAFYTTQYRWKFNPDKNKTILSLVFIANSESIDIIVNAIHSIFLPIAAFFVVVVSTILLVLNLRKKAKWRENVASSSNSLSTRDARVSKMVVVIATLFITCFIPVLFSFTAMVTVPEFKLRGRFNNIFLIMFSYHFALETLNSSLNIFIYHRMSSNYRMVFEQLFGRNKNDIDAKSTT